jgi:hypothetical protein
MSMHRLSGGSLTSVVNAFVAAMRTRLYNANPALCCLLESNLSRVPWSFGVEAALAPRRVAFASGGVFAAVFFIVPEIHWMTPLIFLPASWFRRWASWASSHKKPRTLLSNKSNLQMLPFPLSIVWVVVRALRVPQSPCLDP